MSVTTDTDAVIAGAAAVIRCLPAADLAPGEALTGPAAVQHAIPAPGSMAVTASLAGAAVGSIIIVVSPELAQQLQNGPVGPQELTAALEVGLADATAALAGAFGGNLRHEAAQSMAADVAVSSASSYTDVTVVPLAGPAGPIASLVVMVSIPAAGGTSAEFGTLSATINGDGSVRAVELLNDVEMGVTAELGRTRMTVRELLSLQPGSVVELDRAAGSPVDLLVNGTLVARGEVVVIDEEFGVRITEIIGYDAKGK